MGRPLPHPIPISVPIFGTPIHAPKTVTKFCMVIKLDVSKIFTGSTTLPVLAKIFGDTAHEC